MRKGSLKGLLNDISKYLLVLKGYDMKIATTEDPILSYEWFEREKAAIINYGAHKEDINVDQYSRGKHRDRTCGG